MTRAGEEMILELSSILNSGMFKEAAKKDEKKEDKKDEKKEDKEEAKDEKKDEKKEDKKASMIVGVLQDLVKLAGELDEVGADQASELVDEAMKSIVQNLESKAMFGEEEPGTEGFEEEPSYEGVADVAQTEADMEEDWNDKFFNLIEQILEDKRDDFIAWVEKSKEL